MSDPLIQFLDDWGGGYLAHDIGPKLTCIEAEALACLYLSVGRTQDADSWIENHAESDDCGDLHCRCTAPECIAERNERNGISPEKGTQ